MFHISLLKLCCVRNRDTVTREEAGLGSIPDSITETTPPLIIPGSYLISGARKRIPQLYPAIGSGRSAGSVAGHIFPKSKKMTTRGFDPRAFVALTECEHNALPLRHAVIG
jgi:hypothetical protein